ncbi:MAG: 2-oxoglutarate dehydrogenase E1 component, partial [Bacteroidetes bacterium]|nr:2-oxoglutarate dehydrogenase E1 component [Bacteroidota bacterium]
QMCAQRNMQMVNCTTPANFFHVMRRQLKRNFRKPLVVFTPKSLLRHPLCVSSVQDLGKGNFQEVIDDVSADVKSVKKVVFCTGKLYYELLKAQEEKGVNDTAIVRLEQLYPLPTNKIEAIIEKYQPKQLIWAQEEPENMGAWTHILRKLRHLPFEVVARSASAATASGSSKRSAKRQNAIIEQVFK